MAKSGVSSAKGGAPAKAKSSAKTTPRSNSSADVSEADNGETRPAAKDEDALPDKEEIAARIHSIHAFMRSSSYGRVRGFLHRLAHNPPQVLLLEGGTPEERTAAALYWAVLLNCTTPLEQYPRVEIDDTLTREDTAVLPCLKCAECIRMATRLHRDLFFLDGLAGNIKIDDVRALRGVLGEPPREARYRVIIFREAQALMEAAANSLLKSFEEPRPATAFVLLTPQRERLLPTLVSRSVTLTLPWPAFLIDSRVPSGEDAPLPTGFFAATEGCSECPSPPHWQDSRGILFPAGSENIPLPNTVDDVLAPWEAALCLFLQTGRGWFDRTGSRGAVDVSLVHAILGLCRRALASRILALHTGAPAREGLDRTLARMPAQRLRMMDEVLAECQDSLIYTVNPALVLEWLATRLYLLVPRS